MRRRPWSLVLLAFFHFLAPLGNIIFNAVVAEKDVSEYFHMAMSTAYLGKNWPMLIMPIIAGAAIYACKRWSFYVYLVSITLLFAFSTFGYVSKDGSISIYAALFAYLVNISIVVYILIPAVRNIYFDRRMRWWEARPRYECDYKAQWHFEDDSVVHPGEIGNISINGLFLKSPIMPKEQDLVDIKIPFDNGKMVDIVGKVIFHRDAKRFGFGVQFQLNKESKAQVNELIAQLEAQGKRSTHLQPRPEDSLTYWVRTLLTTGKGLIPKNK